MKKLKEMSNTGVIAKTLDMNYVQKEMYTALYKLYKTEWIKENVTEEDLTRAIDNYADYLRTNIIIKDDDEEVKTPLDKLLSFEGWLETEGNGFNNGLYVSYSEFILNELNDEIVDNCIDIMKLIGRRN